MTRAATSADFRSPHPLWALHGFDTLPRIARDHPTKAHEQTRYPVRYLRYWFVRMLLEREVERLGRPLRVCEVGVDRGQMLAFMGGDPDGKGRFRLPDTISRWDAVDRYVRPEYLDLYSYSHVYEHDLEAGEALELESYDAVVFLHVLEHLFEPERTLERFRGVLSRGGLFLGGSPTMPDVLRSYWERRLRRNVGPNGHVSVISPARLERFAETSGMKVEFLSGAFLMRNGGRSIENSEAWLRLNLAWGAMFPSLGSEVYFALRKDCTKAQPLPTANE